MRRRPSARTGRCSSPATTACCTGSIESLLGPMPGRGQAGALLPVLGRLQGGVASTRALCAPRGGSPTATSPPLPLSDSDITITVKVISLLLGPAAPSRAASWRGGALASGGGADEASG